MRIRWLLVFWMFVVAAISYLDRVNLSVSSSFIQREYGLDNIRLGWVFSAFALGYALFQPLGGRLADRFGPRLVLTLGTLWWGAFTAGTALLGAGAASALIAFLAIRFLLGAGEAVVFPASNRLVASWIPCQERGLANGIIFAGVGAGAALAPPLVTFVMLTYGWRWSFWVSALLGIAAGVVWFAIARDQPAWHPWISDGERATIAEGMPTAGLGGRAAPGWRTILQNRVVLGVTFSYFTYGYAAYIFFTWFFKYLNEVRHLPLNSSSRYGMLPFLAMAVGSPLGGWIGDRLTKRYGPHVGRSGIAVGGMLLAGIFIALSTQVQSARLASLVLAGGAGALYLAQSSFWSVTADVAGAASGAVSGVMNMGGQFGSVITASLTPLIASQFGWSASFLVAAALCAAGALAWLAADPAQDHSGFPEG